jgi:hypothetical protein
MNLSTSSSKPLRRLLRDGLVFALLAGLVYTGLCYFFYAQPQVVIGERGWVTLRQRVVRAQQPLPYQNVYLGDSVGAQFFSFDHMPNAVTANGAILMSGQLVLAGWAMENPEVERVVIAITPESLMRPFEHEMTFANFVKPFYGASNAPHILPLTHERVARHRWGALSWHVPMKFLPFSDVDYSAEDFRLPRWQAYREGGNINGQFRYAILHIQALLKRAESKGKQVVFVCPPVSSGRARIAGDYHVYRAALEAAGLEAAFTDYFDRMIVLEDAAFVDGMHLHPHRLAELKSQVDALLDP